MTSRFTIVVPVKGTAAAKTRFGGTEDFRRDLAHAMALDTVEAATATAGVHQVIVVTSGADAEHFAALGAVVVSDPGAGLNAAITRGLEHADSNHPTAVLLGDVPALTAAELAAALGEALRHPLSIVADADGMGTVLSTARVGLSHVLAFGAGSRAAHAAAGYVSLSGHWPGLRRDVDIPGHLRALARLGPRTAVLVGG